MGTSDWDEDAWGRGRGSRDGRAHDRSARGGASSSASERSDRSGRDVARERGADGPRASSGGWERPRGSQRNDDSGSRGSRRYGGDDGWSRAPRDRRDDSYDGRGDRSPRAPRPPTRDDAWDGRRPGPGGSVSRGGLWGDGEMPRRRQPNGGDPRARSGGRIDPRDPRALRRGLVDPNARAAPPKKSRFSFGTAILIVLAMLLIGAGAAYAYYRVSTPTVHGPSPSAPGATSAPVTPSTSPSASPSATPHSNVPAAHPLYVVL
ncbi:MAG TPA: hypothetical protein VKT52_10085 [Ktedonobacterales bacterium]|nr:hypothetical protein [Ktedonobacterales bacterium]